MTVAGSGEFAHTFINGGAKEVVMFDISPSAAFFGELRHQALCNLDMQTYIKLFEPFTIESDSDDDEDVTNIINFQIYRQIREHLTRDAREYFDTVENNPAVANVKRFSWSGLARMRTNKKYKFNRLVGEIITKDSEYLKLQEKAKKTKVHMSLVDVSNLDYLVATKKPDILYISNIAYFPERTLAIAKKYIDLGVKEVICTISSNSEDFAGDYDSKLRNRTFAVNGEPLMVGSKFIYELYKPNSFDAIPVSIEVLGLDRNADYGITLKATK